MSFKKAREQLLWAFDENFISAEEFLLLYDVNKSTNLDLPYDEYSPFDLENMEDDEYFAEFRVRERDLNVLANVLRITEEFTLEQRSVIVRSAHLILLFLLKYH